MAEGKFPTIITKSMNFRPRNSIVTKVSGVGDEPNGVNDLSWESVKKGWRFCELG